MQKNVLLPGQVAGNYDEKWTKTFDLQFLILWLVLFTVLLVWTLGTNPQEFWTAMVVFPPVMTLAEAFSPHSMDTPIMMLIGFSLLFGICAIF